MMNKEARLARGLRRVFSFLMNTDTFTLLRPEQQSHQISGLHVEEAVPLCRGCFGHLVLMVQKAAVERDVVAVACIAPPSPAGVGLTRDFTWDEDQPLMFDCTRMRRAMFEEIDDATFEAIYSHSVPE